MKRLLLFFALISTSIYGSSVYPPCDNAARFNGCGIDVGFDFLYLQPCFEKDEAAALNVSTTGFITGTYEVFNYRWQPAFRVSLWLEDLLCNFSLKASYLYLAQDTHRELTNVPNGNLSTSIINSNLDPAFQNFNHLNLAHNFTYHNFDIGLVRGYLWGTCHLITPFLAIEGMIIDQTYKVSGDPIVIDAITDLATKQRGHQWGAGLKLGSGYSYWILKCLRFHSQAAISLVYGNLCEKIQQDSSIIPTVGTPILNHLETKNKDCICLPAIRVAVGFDYQVNVCDFPIALSLGYEFMQWFNVWSYRENRPSFPQSGISSRSNFGFNGLNIGLTVCF